MSEVLIGLLLLVIGYGAGYLKGISQRNKVLKTMNLWGLGLHDTIKDEFNNILEEVRKNNAH